MIDINEINVNYKQLCIFLRSEWLLKSLKKKLRWWLPKFKGFDASHKWAYAIIRCTKNNIFLTILSSRGLTINTITSGKFFSGKKKRSRFASKSIAIKVARKLKEDGIKYVKLYLHSPVFDKRTKSTMEGFHKSGLRVVQVKQYLRKSHNGLRLRTARRK